MRFSKLALWLAALVFLLIIVSVLFGSYTRSSAPNANNGAMSQEHGPRIPPPQPPMTASDTIAEQDLHPFSVLISYVDTGFEPTLAHVHVGDTVRFTNNASTDLWVASSGARLYPNVQNGCGPSALDSCHPLKPGEYWQFTFAKSGTWNYVNNLDKSKQGTVIVQ